MKFCLSLMLLLAALPAAAQINKCKGPDGKVSYQDTPCATAGGQELNVHTKPTDPYSRYDSEVQAQRDINAAERLDRQRDLQQRQADIDRSAKDRERQAKTSRCAGYKTDAARAEYWAGRYGSGRMQEYERDRAQALRDQHWSECFSGQ